jgi:hypothetical protein
MPTTGPEAETSHSGELRVNPYAFIFKDLVFLWATVAISPPSIGVKSFRISAVAKSNIYFHGACRFGLRDLSVSPPPDAPK